MSDLTVQIKTPGSTVSDVLHTGLEMLACTLISAVMFVEEEIAKKPFVGFVAQAFRTRSPSVPAWKATV